MGGADQGTYTMKRRLPKIDSYRAPDGLHYWNCWTSNYRRADDGYTIHAFCEEDRTGRALCGVRTAEGGGESFPRDGWPSCVRCKATMVKRGALVVDSEGAAKQTAP